MRRLGPLALLGAAALLQVVAAGLVGLLAELAYGASDPRLPHALERPLLLVALGLGGLAAGTLLARGLYRLHAERTTVAAWLATLVYLPPLGVAAVLTWGLWFLV